MTAEANILLEIRDRLAAVELRLKDLVQPQTVKEYYSISEIALRLGKAAFTVREWARNRRILAKKHHSGRGPHAAWVVSHEELLRLEREGLLPLPVFE